MKKGSKRLVKRTLAVALTCVMVLSLFPTAAFAARLEREVAEIPAVNDGAADLAELPVQPLEADTNPSGARTYYVSIGGKGGNNGLSQDKPLPGLDAVPWDKLAGGDQVLLKKGDTFPGTIRLVGVQGRPDAPIVIGAYGADGEAAPVIEARGQGIWLQETGSTSTVGKYASSGVLLYGCSYITVDGLDISNRPDKLKTSFQDLPGVSDNVGVSDHSDEKLAYSGVAVAADGSAAADGIVLSNITVHGDEDVTAVITETSSTVSQTAVTKGAAAPVRTCENTSGTYYVSSVSGCDSNDGSSPENAFYSLHKINELNLQPGAKVYLERGSVFENQYLHIEGSGNSAQPIIIDAYGSGAAPVINTNGNGVWYQNYLRNLDNARHLRQGYVSSCVRIYDVEYIEVKNIAMTNFGRYDETPGADFENLGTYDGGTVPGETGYNSNGNTVGCYQWGGKMSRTGVAGVSQNVGTMDHVYLQNLDIENIYGNIMHKHMDNGGIYFTIAAALDETQTGIPNIDDLRIEGCYLKRTSRWGIAAAYTGAYCNSFNGAAISDETCRKYGVTNLYIGHNYIEEVGGDPITTMYAYEPLVEYNVSYNGGREMPGATYMNGSHIYGNKGNVSAGIWPWKCKTALFEHNECYTMMYGANGNNDAQAWDADYGDSTIYQYNYSSGNTGGCVMFCYVEAYNTVFRYNVSYKDGVANTHRGVMDISSSPNGQISNNTFVVTEGTPIPRTDHAGNAHIENNIFFNLGNPYDAQWARNGLTYNNNLYAGFAGTPANDSNPVTVGKDTLFSDVAFTNAPEAPAATEKNGVRTVNGIRDWTHDWNAAFNMFKLKDTTNAAVNAGVSHNYTGLTQDSNFGVPRVPNNKDFYGNSLDEVHDIGAYDTQTDSEPVLSSDCELVSSLYEVRGTNIQVPLGTNLSPTVETFLKGLTVSDRATAKVYQSDGATEVTDAGTKVAADMKVKIVAEDGTENSYTIKNKNSYNHASDWVDRQQGNVWFHQFRMSDGSFENMSWGGGENPGWWGGSAGTNHAVAERDHAGDDVASDPADRKYYGAGFTFRAPITGNVTVSFPVQPKFRVTASSNNAYTTNLVIYLNGVEKQSTLVPKGGGSNVAAVQDLDLTVAQGDTIEIMVVNTGDTRSFSDNNNGVTFTPAVTYKNEAASDIPADTKAPTAPVGLRVSNITATTANVTWGASTDNRGVTGYQVQVDEGAVETVSELTKTLTGLTENTEYTVTVKAVDAANNSSQPATVTFRTAKAPDNKLPTVPPDGQAASVTATTATISWTASTDNVGVDHYEVKVDGRTIEVRNVTEATLTGLTANTPYTARVKAVDAAGNKSDALAITFTTAAAPAVTAPNAPEALAVFREVPRESTTVRWFPAADGAPTVSYKVQVDGGEQVDVNDTVYTFSTPEVKTEHTVKVWAVGETGLESADCATLTFTTQGSGAKELVSSIFEVRDSGIQVPYTANDPTTVAELKAGLTVSPAATVRVYDGNTVVTDGDTALTDSMTVRIVAENLSESAPYAIVQKNTYNHFDDWRNNTQGEVWFTQRKNAQGVYEDYIAWTAEGTGGWYGGESGNGYASAERVGACDDIRPEAEKVYQGSGFTFRAPVTGMVEVSFAGETKMRKDGCSGNTYTTNLVVYLNGVEAYRKVLPKNTTPQQMPTLKFAVEKGDRLQFMALNEGSTANGGQGGVQFNPVVTYLNEAYVPAPTSIAWTETPGQNGITLYTNTTETTDRKRTAQLSVTILPEGSNHAVAWESGKEDVVTVNSDGLVTAVGDGNTFVRATMNSGLANPGANQEVTCQVHVRTRMESITVKKDGVAIGDTVKLYTNKSDPNHSVTLTAETVPAVVTHPTLNWTRPDGAEGKISMVRNGASVTLTATENELDVGPVAVQVASAEHSDINTTFTVQVIRRLENNVTISGTAKFGRTLTADLNKLSMSDAGKRGLTFKWYRTGEDGVKTEIPGEVGQTYVLQEADVGKVISVDVIADPATFYEGTRSASISGTVKLADNDEVPTGLSATDCGADAADGTITGLDSTKKYEYQLEGESNWTPVDEGAEVIEGLAAGNYRVRFAETNTHAAGTNAATVTVLRAGVTAYEITATVAPADSGVVELSANRAEAGTEITITATPKLGYRLTAITAATTGDPAEEIAVTDGKFEMPAANVTVTATFETVPLLTLTHELENINCDQDEHEHKVEYGGTLTIHLTAAEGYTMPGSVTVTKEDGSEFTAFRYSRTSETEATLIFNGEEGITENLIISGEGVIKTWKVNYTVTNGLEAPDEGAPRDVNYKAAYTGTLVAKEGFDLPETIVVTMGGSLIGSENYTYDPEHGTITIPEGIITGNIVITASGVDTRVDPVSVTGVTLNRTEANVTVGGTLNLTATVAPADATNKTVAWATADESIATVDENGKVTGVAEGTTTITVMTVDGRQTAECVVNVTEATSPSRPSGGSNPSTETTKTETRDDGAKVTTVTKPDGTVTETVEQPDGAKTETVTAKDGSVTITATDPEGEELAKVEIPATIPEPEVKFDDISATPWAVESINNVAGLALVKGTGGTKYDPIAPMTRGSLATVLHRLSQGKTDYENTFKDVAQGKYYTEGVTWAAKAKVVTGYSADIFAPDDVITREQLAVMLARYAKLIGMNTKADSKAVESFADGDSTGAWAVDGVAWCVENGILKGKGGNTLDPSSNVTRAEVAVMLDRFIALMK